MIGGDRVSGILATIFVCLKGAPAVRTVGVGRRPEWMDLAAKDYQNTMSSASKTLPGLSFVLVIGEWLVVGSRQATFAGITCPKPE